MNEDIIRQRLIMDDIIQSCDKLMDKYKNSSQYLKLKHIKNYCIELLVGECVQYWQWFINMVYYESIDDAYENIKVVAREI